MVQRVTNKTGAQIANEKKRKRFEEEQALQERQKQFSGERTKIEAGEQKTQIQRAPFEQAQKEAQIREEGRQTAPQEIPQEIQKPEQSKLSTALDYLSAPLSKPITTLKEGFGAGAEAVRASREQIAGGDKMEAAKVIGTTAATTAAVGGVVSFAGGLLAGAEIHAAGIATTTAKAGIMKLSVGKILAFGGAATLITKQAGSATAILSSSQTQIDEIIGDVQAGAITENVARQRYAEVKSNIASAEKTVNFVSKLNVLNFLGLKDNLVKFQYFRDNEDVIDEAFNQALIEGRVMRSRIG